MSSKKDWHARGEKDAEKPDHSGWIPDLAGALVGHDRSNYNPPTHDKDAKKEYDAGWRNVKNRK